MQWMGQGVGQKREEDSSGLTPLPSEFGRDLGFTFWIFFVWILRFSRESKPGKEYIEASWLVRDFHGDLRAEMLRFHCDISFPKSISILQVRSILHHSLFFRVQLQLKAHTHQTLPEIIYLVFFPIIEETNLESLVSLDQGRLYSISLLLLSLTKQN